MNDYTRHNAEQVLEKIDYYIERGGSYPMTFVYDDLSIFDWWPSRLTQTHLKQMRAFVKEAIKLGFKGYVCFKVGASGCANGMWAYKELSKDEASTLSTYEQAQNSSVSGITENTDIVLLEPREFEETREIGFHIKGNRACCINLHHLDPQYRQRTIDFLSGVVYGVDGTIKKIGDKR